MHQLPPCSHTFNNPYSNTSQTPPPLHSHLDGLLDHLLGLLSALDVIHAHLLVLILEGGGCYVLRAVYTGVRVCALDVINAHLLVLVLEMFETC